MHKSIYFILTIFLFINCTIEEDWKVDNTVMPEQTTEGANTFGCLIDGWVYAGGRYLYSWPSSYGHGKSSHLFLYDPEENLIEVQVMVKWNVWIKFTILNPEENKEVAYIDASFGPERLRDGTVCITRFDPERQIVSGRFEGGRMTHGRFDVIYVIKED